MNRSSNLFLAFVKKNIKALPPNNKYAIKKSYMNVSNIHSSEITRKDMILFPVYFDGSISRKSTPLSIAILLSKFTKVLFPLTVTNEYIKLYRSK